MNHTLVYALLLATSSANGQVISTYAGSDAFFTGVGQLAETVQLSQPHGIAVDASGNYYVAATGQHVILKVSTTGLVSIVAGNGLNRISGDGGLATSASLSGPQGLTIDTAGNLIIVDRGNNRVRKVNRDGVITTIAGSGMVALGDGGPATQASFAAPRSVVTDSAGNLYISDTGNSRVRQISPTGVIRTVAGNGTVGATGDGGPAVEASLDRPVGLAIDSSDNIYVSDWSRHRVRRFKPGGNIETVAGIGTAGFSGDGGPATAARLTQPYAVAIDPSGNLLIADSGNHRIRRVSQSGVITTIGGTGDALFNGDGGLATAAAFSHPEDMAFDSSGSMLICDSDNNRVRRIQADGTVTAAAGRGFSIGDSRPAANAVITRPIGIAVDTQGNVFISDTSANLIRKVSPSGIISTVAGNGLTGGGSATGAASSIGLNQPWGVSVDASGTIYFADSNANVVRRVSPNGESTLFAGNFICCQSADGVKATETGLYFPTSTAIDAVGNVYFVNRSRAPDGRELGLRVRKVTAAGIISTVAGSGQIGFDGDGGPAINASFGLSLWIASAADGTLFIADSTNHRVRRVSTSGVVTTIAGSGQNTTSGDGGAALAAGVPAPSGLAVDGAGNIFITTSDRIRRVTPAGMINTVAGNGTLGFSGDGGAPIAATLANPNGVAVDSSGKIYIADTRNARVRLVQTGRAAMRLSTLSLRFNSADALSQSFNVENNGQAAFNWSVTTSTASGGNWLSVTPTEGSMEPGKDPVTLNVTLDPSGLEEGEYYGVVEVSSATAANSPQSVTVRLTVAGGSTAQPLITGVSNAASPTTNIPFAPGTLIVITGTDLADEPLQADPSLWPTTLGATSATISGRPFALASVSPDRIEAMLPFGLTANSLQPLIVKRGLTVSTPLQVPIVSSQPAVFVKDGSLVASIVSADDSLTPVASDRRAKAGEIVAVTCAGLGDVVQQAVAGVPFSADLVSNVVDRTTVTVGGLDARVVFVRAIAGTIGMYQAQFVVPDGIATKPDAPLIVTQGTRSSAAVTLPVE